MTAPIFDQQREVQNVSTSREGALAHVLSSVGLPHGPSANVASFIERRCRALAIAAWADGELVPPDGITDADLKRWAVDNVYAHAAKQYKADLLDLAGRLRKASKAATTRVPTLNAHVAKARTALDTAKARAKRQQVLDEGYGAFDALQPHRIALQAAIGENNAVVCAAGDFISYAEQLEGIASVPMPKDTSDRTVLAQHVHSGNVLVSI